MSGVSFVSWHRKLLDLLWPCDPVTGQRRLHKRHASCEKVTIRWKMPSPGATAADVKDVSVDGMRVETPEPVQAPLVVQISGENREHVGVVLYCEKSGSKFLTGIQLLEPDDPVRLMLDR
ncbi:MAG: PilZ domain-containing protein [Acidobacteria bacterium]|nr:PilZ domain-containing protein [Acidobacteriota bacterium]